MSRPLLALAAAWLVAAPVGAQPLVPGPSLDDRPTAAEDGSARATAKTFLEDFEDGDNPYELTLGIPQAETIEASGGNPGRWLRNQVLDTFIPMLSARLPPFTGNFVARGARSIRLDAQTLDASFGVPGRPFTLVLTTFNGQPGNPNAYDYVYISGGTAPQVGQGWKSYAYPIPSRFAGELPPGWTGGYAGDPENLRPGVVWQDVLRRVDEVAVWWGSPAFFYIGQQFDLGVDNVRIDYVSPARDGATADPLGVTAEPSAGSGAGHQELALTADASRLDAGAPLSDRVTLHPNHPNPFSQATTVGFSVPRSTPVVLDVFDATGRRVCRLADGVFEVGQHTVSWQASGLPAGVYSIRLQTDRAVQVHRAVLVP